MDCLDRLPPDLVARFHQSPWELEMPVYTTGGISVAQDRAMQRAEREAFAPWKHALARARQAGQAGGAAKRRRDRAERRKSPCTSAGPV